MKWRTNMKFCDMPYQRIDFAEAEKNYLCNRNVINEQRMRKLKITELNRISAEEFKQAEDAEAQFEVHKKYYKLTDKVSTQITLASIRHTLDTTDEFYEKEQVFSPDAYGYCFMFC